MTEITQEGWKNKALSMLLAQLTSYVLFIAATVIPSPGTVPIIPLIIARSDVGRICRILGRSAAAYWIVSSLWCLARFL